MRVHAPPMMWPCYLGVDLARRDELIAARMTVPDIGRFIGADSIGYLSLEGLLEAIDAPDAGFCTGCLTGQLSGQRPDGHGQAGAGTGVAKGARWQTTR